MPDPEVAADLESVPPRFEKGVEHITCDFESRNGMTSLA